MIIYIVIATFLYLGFFISEKIQEIYYKISIAILFLFTAFRDISLGGTDAFAYQSFFYYKVPLLSDILNYDYDFEFGYALLNSAIKTIVNDYRFYQIIYCTLSTILLCIVIKKLELNKQERNLFLFVYFCYRYMWNVFVLLRQNIATLIIWIILLAFLDKPIKYYFNAVITYFFHSSSVVNLINYPILKKMKNINKKILLIITICISVVFLIFSKSIFNSLTLFLIQITGPRYGKYFLDEQLTQGFNVFNYAIKWFFVLLFYFNYEKIKYYNRRNILNISFIVLVLSSINTAIVNRMVEYYMIAIYVMIAICYRAFDKKMKPLYIWSIYIIFIITLIRFLYTFTEGQLSSYSIFSFN